MQLPAIAPLMGRATRRDATRSGGATRARRTDWIGSDRIGSNRIGMDSNAMSDLICVDTLIAPFSGLSSPLPFSLLLMSDGGARDCLSSHLISSPLFSSPSRGAARRGGAACVRVRVFLSGAVMRRRLDSTRLDSTVRSLY